VCARANYKKNSVSAWHVYNNGLRRRGGPVSAGRIRLSCRDRRRCVRQRRRRARVGAQGPIEWRGGRRATTTRARRTRRAPRPRLRDSLDRRRRADDRHNNNNNNNNRQYAAAGRARTRSPPPRGSSPPPPPPLSRRRSTGFPGRQSLSRTREPAVAGYDCDCRSSLCGRRWRCSSACFIRPRESTIIIFWAMMY